MIEVELDRVLEQINPDEVCQLALDLCRIPSPTGEEGELARFVVDWYRGHGLQGVLQPVDGDRANGIGILRGEGRGPSLTLNGHLDTGSRVRYEQIVGPIPPQIPVMEPYLAGGILYGTGMDNMQSGLAAIMYAARAIKESGVRLLGDLIVAEVCGEVSRASVDHYQGHLFRSRGIGTRYLLTHGYPSDYAIVADTSHFGVTWAQCGLVYAKVTVEGRAVYTPYTVRTADRRESQNALIKMTLLIDAFENWAEEYERTSVYQFAGGEIRPKASIGAIVGGVPYKVDNTPMSCGIYVDIRTPPGKRPIDLRRQLQAALDEVGVDYRLELFASQMGYEGKGVEPLVEALQEAHRTIVGKPIPAIEAAENSMWTDTNLYNELGIPAVKFGIGTALRPGESGEVHGMVRVPDSTSVEDLVNATKIYSAACLRICRAAA